MAPPTEPDDLNDVLAAADSFLNSLESDTPAAPIPNIGTPSAAPAPAAAEPEDDFTDVGGLLNEYESNRNEVGQNDLVPMGRNPDNTPIMKTRQEAVSELYQRYEAAKRTNPAGAKSIMEQIDALHQESETQQARLSELEALTEQSRMLHQEFAFHQEMIESFASAVDSATLEEKRRLLRTIVKKVVWDGKNAYVYLFAEDGEADLPPIDQPMYPLGEDSE